MNAYYQCLNGNVTYGGQDVNVYGVGVAQDERFHYIHLRPESENDLSNKSSFVTSAVIVVDIYTVHEGSIDYSVVEDIDRQVRQLLFPTRTTTGLADASGMQITISKMENSVYLDGFNGTRHEYRKVTRFFNRINQLN